MTDEKANDRAARAFKKEDRAREGAKAAASYAQEGVAARKNMERLRAERLAREAEETANPCPPPAKKQTSSKISPKGKRKANKAV